MPGREKNATPLQVAVKNGWNFSSRAANWRTGPRVIRGSDQNTAH